MIIYFYHSFINSPNNSYKSRSQLAPSCLSPSSTNGIALPTNVTQPIEPPPSHNCALSLACFVHLRCIAQPWCVDHHFAILTVAFRLLRPPIFGFHLISRFSFFIFVYYILNFFKASFCFLSLWYPMSHLMNFNDCLNIYLILYCLFIYCFRDLSSNYFSRHILSSVGYLEHFLTL